MTSSTRTSQGRTRSPRCARGSPASSARPPRASASSSATRPTCARSSSRSATARRSCAAPTRRPCSRSPTPSRRATPTPGKHAERVAAYGLRIAHAAGVDGRPAGRVRLPAARRRQGRRARRDPVQARPAHRRGARADGRRTPRSARRSCATSTSSTTRRSSCATTTSAGTGTGYPDGLAGEAIPRPGARVRASPTRWTRSPPTGRTARPSAGPRRAQVIRSDAGTQFDPAIVAAYDTVPDEAFARIRDGIA